MVNAIRGRSDYLQPYLEEAVEKADKIRLIIAFVMESGAKMIAPCLKSAAVTGVGKTYLAAFDSLPYRRILFCLTVRKS